MWIAIGVVGLLVVLGVVVFVVSSQQMKAWEQKLKDEGELVMCWIVDAQEDLHEEHNVPGYGNARVVFSLDGGDDLKKRLKEAAKRLKKGDIVDENADVDKIENFYEKYKNLKWLDAPLKLPKWLVGDVKVYTAVVQVYWRRLPDNQLSLPYIYAYVLTGEGGGTVHAEYPDDEDEE